MTLGFRYRDQLPAVSAGTGGCPTFVDLVPRLREVGADLLLANMRLHRDNLKQILNSAGFQALATDKRLSSGAEQGVKQVSHVDDNVDIDNIDIDDIDIVAKIYMDDIILCSCSGDHVSEPSAESLVWSVAQQCVSQVSGHPGQHCHGGDHPDRDHTGGHLS